MAVPLRGWGGRVVRACHLKEEEKTWDFFLNLLKKFQLLGGKAVMKNFFVRLPLFSFSV